MADQPDIHIGENSPEHIAFKLYIAVGVAEKKIKTTGFAQDDVDRKYILDTYAECLLAVTKPGNRF